MRPILVRSIGGYEGSAYPHPQRQLDASLQAAGYQVEALELPQNTAPDYPTCLAFLRAQLQGLEHGVLMLHSLASRLFFLLVETARQQGPLHSPLVDTAVLLAPANGRYLADWVPEVAAFFAQNVWVPELTGTARRLLLVTSDNDPYWEEAAADLEVFRQQPGVEVLVLAGQGHLNQAEVSQDLPEVRAWLLQTERHL
ncbi:MAG: hypothetical protein FJZ47_13215 [Candidatus Tectomicrobia bacterium]|uniref:Alpha/beta hydrolase n=1 Tax=Tectimicrobiota bacterium TaxID=2528274 RepID=A0A937W0R2_UNCTE|nr:hypothetical protein [Candidatus Tectomicrobia bacterium]